MLTALDTGGGGGGWMGLLAALPPHAVKTAKLDKDASNRVRDNFIGLRPAQLRVTVLSDIERSSPPQSKHGIGKIVFGIQIKF
jgi:hypothetical protein